MTKTNLVMKILFLDVLLLSAVALLSLGAIDGTDAVLEPEQYAEGKWESNPDSPLIRLPLSESSHQLSLVLGFDPRQRVASLRGRHRLAEQRWPLLPSYQAQYDLSRQGEEGEFEEQGVAPNPFASRLVDVLMPASKRLQNGLGPRLNRGVGMMRMG